LVLVLLGAVLAGCGAAPVAETWPGLTVDGDTVYVISGTPQQVYMLDVETLQPKGTFLPAGEHEGVLYWSPVALGEDLAFVGFAAPGSGVAGLYAFDPEACQEQWPQACNELWSYPAESLMQPAPVYADGVVYFGSDDGKLYAVDVETRGVKPGWPFEAEDAIWGSPLVAEGRVYLAAMDHHVYALDAEDGQEMWKTRVGGAMAAQPILDAARGVLYSGAFDGKLHAIDADSGETVEGFEFQAENWLWSTALLVDETLYTTSLDGRLYALDPVSGARLWSYPGESEDAEDILRAGPVEAGDFIAIAGESGTVAAVKDAQQQWSWSSSTAPPTGAIYTAPVVENGTVYVVLRNGDVQALDAETGVPGPTFPSPGAE
jgi:outer membrane protein assembly factor BamB